LIEDALSPKKKNLIKVIQSWMKTENIFLYINQALEKASSYKLGIGEINGPLCPMLYGSRKLRSIFLNIEK